MVKLKLVDVHWCSCPKRIPLIVGMLTLQLRLASCIMMSCCRRSQQRDAEILSFTAGNVAAAACTGSGPRVCRHMGQYKARKDSIGMTSHPSNFRRLDPCAVRMVYLAYQIGALLLASRTFVCSSGTRQGFQLPLIYAPQGN